MWKPRTWAILLGLATVVGILEALQLYAGYGAMGVHRLPFSRAASATMPSWYMLALLSPGVVWMARRFPIGRGGRRWIPAHLVGAVVFTIVNLSLASYLSDFVFYHSPRPISYLENLERLVGTYFMMDVFNYVAILGLWSAFEYHRRYVENARTAADLELRASRLETSLANANLQALRMQLNPHFLFNALNSVSVLALKGERRKVATMLSRLSELLRSALDNAEQFVPLGQEIGFLERYLQIEQLRFGERLSIRLDVPEELLDAEVPSLLLQPLVENAIGHGVSSEPGPGQVEVRADRLDHTLRLRVSDTGPGFPPSDLPARAGGVGLANTRSRLEQLYGGAHRLSFENPPGGGAVVTIVLPLRLPANAGAEPEQTGGEAWIRSAL